MQGGGSNKGSFQGKCNYCHKKGHMVWDCLKLKKKKEKEANNEEANACAGNDKMVLISDDNQDSKSYPMTLRFGDSGAIGHMTNLEEGLMNIEDCTSTITIGNGKVVKVTKMGTLQGTAMHSDRTEQ